jgi:hypothetical protein
MAFKMEHEREVKMEQRSGDWEPEQYDLNSEVKSEQDEEEKRADMAAHVVEQTPAEERVAREQQYDAEGY